MAVLTIAAFISKWGTTNFPSTGLRAITGAKMREFKDDIADSFQSVLGATTITSWKSPCVVATTANITLSGEQTIDGVLTSVSRVLVKNQTSTLQNGIYVSAVGAWSRSTDADSAAELEGAAVGVTQGTTNQNTVWVQTTDSITLETSAIAWQQVGYAATVNVLDEDDFASDSATEPPSQQSVKSYVDAKISSATVTVSSAEILSLNSSPKTLVAAPGAGLFLQILGYTAKYTYVSAPYATNTTLQFLYGGANYHQVFAVLDESVNRWFDLRANFGPTNTDMENKAFTLTVNTGNPTGGSGTLKIYVTYKVITI